MKRIVIFSITILLAVSAAIAQPKTVPASKENKKESKAERIALRKLEGKDVSNASLQSFSVDYPNCSNVTWKRSPNFDEASFTDKNGLMLTAFYDADGKLVGTTRYVTFDVVPVKGQQEIKKHYKDYTIGKVLFFDDNEANESDMILWAAQFDDADNYFVELTKGNETSIVKVDMEGMVSYFAKIK
jgi:hypothetical protein